VLPQIAQQLPGECSPVSLYTAINRQGVVFLWPVKLPAPDGKITAKPTFVALIESAGHLCSASRAADACDQG
jgi:hypothetical protein